MQFKELKLIPPLVRAISQVGYTTATEIQYKAIPSILKGRDVLGCAQTGTGKTAAFAIPILQNLQSKKQQHSGIRALVLTPTRELALQIESSFKSYGKHLPLRYLSVLGGVSANPQIRGLKKGVDVLIATPGRLLDLIQQGYIDLSKLEILVLDEADRMLDMGFIKDVRKIISYAPSKHQTLLFSATMPKSIRKFANSILKNPIEVSVASVSSTTKTIDQSVYFIEKKNKTGLLIELFKDKSIAQSLVFTRTKYGADKLVKKLAKKGIFAAAIHGNKSQNARQRTLGDFKKHKIRVLVATDIASRGLDIEELPHVVNYEIPNIAETYVHRIGRTGRAGKKGTAISFCDQDERKHFKDIQKLIGFNIPIKHAHRAN
ncbi:MAG TPA: DEAD/DEAH box helicase [Flavobacteriaceae bacterium]|nr:DEAD/DEAH box helicase [Flavobacteriaceae bacterium]